MPTQLQCARATSRPARPSPIATPARPHPDVAADPVAPTDLPVSRFEWGDGVAWEPGTSWPWDAPDALGSVPPAAAVGLRFEAAQRHAARAGCIPLIDLRPPDPAKTGTLWEQLRDLPCTRWVPVRRGLLPGWIESDLLAETWRYLVVPADDAVMPPLIHRGDLVLLQLRSIAVRGTVVLAHTPQGAYTAGQLTGFCPRNVRAPVELSGLDPQEPPLVLPRVPWPVVGRVVARWSRHPDRLPPSCLPRWRDGDVRGGCSLDVDVDW